MNLLRLTAKPSSPGVSAQRPGARQCAADTSIFGFSRQALRALTAALLATALAGGTGSPAFAQDPGQSPPASQQEQRPELPTPQSPEQNRPNQDPNSPTQAPQPVYGSGPTNPPIPVSLGVSKYNYQNPPRPFPTLLAPYRGIDIPEFNTSNKPRVDTLIHDGKLEITLQDAVELALENNMDIAVARYQPWFADTDILSTKGGGQAQGTNGAEVFFSTANVPFLQLDPSLAGSVGYAQVSTPINNPFISGTGTASNQLTGLISHSAQYNWTYNQGFTSGTSVTATWDNTRSSSSAANLFNPSVQSSLTITFQQQLLNGFGFAQNRRNITIAKNNRKLADYEFTQQAITTVTNAINAYWELVYARENVKVQEQAVTVSTKLYGDNKKQLEIGTMAPLDVTRAESELATDRQNLIIAQTVKYTDEQTLKNAIVRDPLASTVANVEIVPLDHPNPPEAVEAATFEDAVKEAFAKRPDLMVQAINVTNAGIDAKSNLQALKPTAALFAQYESQGLAGNAPITTGAVTTAGAPIVGADGTPITVLDATGTPVEVFTPNASAVTSGVTKQGFGTTQSQIFHNDFPSYIVGLNLTLPIRNRVAQASYQRATLNQRQIEAQLQQMKNAAVLDVRNAFIQLTQDRAQVQAASKARELQQATFDAEQKRYQLGASTVYNVILTQRDLISAQGAELRALANLVEAKANYERAVGRTLDVNRVTIADAKHGQVDHDTLIPGTLNGQVVGVDKIFSNKTEGQR
ncbi:MAG TPA: TolC family protein [Candidatus Acidoferrum sp.]|jgi:outer membrane protein TolC|nr:TolC family protein [Candidatus Acidoferrum sp.]